MLAVIVITVFVIVMLLTAALTYPMVYRRVTVRSRVHRLIPRAESSPGLIPTLSLWQILLADLGSKIDMKSTDLLKYREMITSGGFNADKTNVFMGGKLLLTVLLPSLYMLFYPIPKGTVLSSTSLLMSVILAISGYLLPTFWLDQRVKNRKIDIFHTLPDVLDLLTICVESGQSLDAALIKTVDNFHNKHNPLITEIDQVIMEIRAGRVRGEALKGLADRTKVDDVRSFVNMLHQTEKFGTSLGKTLRTYSSTQRIKRRQIAEEQAAKTATKILIPLILFIFPGLMVVILAPAVANILNIFK